MDDRFAFAATVGVPEQHCDKAGRDPCEFKFWIQIIAWTEIAHLLCQGEVLLLRRCLAHSQHGVIRNWWVGDFDTQRPFDQYHFWQTFEQRAGLADDPLAIKRGNGKFEWKIIFKRCDSHGGFQSENQRIIVDFPPQHCTAGNSEVASFNTAAAACASAMQWQRSLWFRGCTELHGDRLNHQE
jgi:hypothetical protein